MSNKGSDDSNPRGGRRPAPRRPVTGGSRRPAPRRPAGRPAPQPEPEQLDDEDRTQALNLADFAGLEDAPQFVDEDDRTVSVDAAALKARVAASAFAADEDDDDEGEATVAMQIPEGLFDEEPAGSSKTLLGHPGLSSRTSNAVRGARPAPARETLAMDRKAVQAAAQRMAAPAMDDDDEGEATMAMNVDDMLSQIDGGGPSDDDEGEATMAMNVDDMLSQIDDSGSADEDEDERTMAVDMNAMLDEIEGGAPVDDDEDEATQAVSLDDMIGQIDAPARPAPAFDDPADDGAPDWAAAAAAAPAPAAAAAVTGALGSAPSREGFFGSMAYALSYDGRRAEIDAGLAAIDAGAADASLRSQYEAEQAALDPAAMKQGWIMFGALSGGITVLILILGMVL